MRGEHCLLVGRTVVFAVYNATAKLNQWRHLTLHSELPGANSSIATETFWAASTNHRAPDLNQTQPRRPIRGLEICYRYKEGNQPPLLIIDFKSSTFNIIIKKKVQYNHDHTKYYLASWINPRNPIRVKKHISNCFICRHIWKFEWRTTYVWIHFPNTCWY